MQRNKRPPLTSEWRSFFLFGRHIKAGIQVIDVFAVHPLLGQTQRFAKSLEVDHLSFPEELDGIVDIWIIGKAQNVVVGDTGLLLCCDGVRTTFQMSNCV